MLNFLKLKSKFLFKIENLLGNILKKKKRALCFIPIP